MKIVVGHSNSINACERMETNYESNNESRERMKKDMLFYNILRS